MKNQMKSALLASVIVLTGTSLHAGSCGVVEGKFGDVRSSNYTNFKVAVEFSKELELNLYGEADHVVYSVRLADNWGWADNEVVTVARHANDWDLKDLHYTDYVKDTLSDDLRHLAVSRELVRADPLYDYSTLDNSFSGINASDRFDTLDHVTIGQTVSRLPFLRARHLIVRPRLGGEYRGLLIDQYFNGRWYTSVVPNSDIGAMTNAMGGVLAKLFGAFTGTASTVGFAALSGNMAINGQTLAAFGAGLTSATSCAGAIAAATSAVTQMETMNEGFGQNWTPGSPQQHGFHPYIESDSMDNLTDVDLAEYLVAVGFPDLNVGRLTVKTWSYQVGGSCRYCLPDNEDD